MTTDRHTEAAFETVIEAHLLAHGYTRVAGGYDAARAIFPDLVIQFIQKTQPREWARLEALHAQKTADLVLVDLCKWMDTYGSLHTLRHGFKCYGRTLRVAYFKATPQKRPVSDHASGQPAIETRNGMERRCIIP